MTRFFFWASVAVFLGCGFLIPNAFAQSGPFSQSGGNRTELGKSQNTAEDLVNSLTPGKPRFDKGEKKSEVDPRTLQCKTVKDATFSGSLNDIGVDWNGDKMGKLHGSGDTDSKPVKQRESAEKDPKASNHTGSSQDKEKASKSAEASSDVQKKEEKTSTGLEEKAGKSDGNH